MGVVIETFVKYPGGPTRMPLADITCTLYIYIHTHTHTHTHTVYNMHQ
jgi:hypothetical protein